MAKKNTTKLQDIAQNVEAGDCKIFCVNVFNGLFSEAAPGFENVEELL